MATNEASTDLWRQLFAAVTGDATNDAAVVREFCDLHGVTHAGYGEDARTKAGGGA